MTCHYPSIYFLSFVFAPLCSFSSNKMAFDYEKLSLFWSVDVSVFVMRLTLSDTLGNHGNGVSTHWAALVLQPCIIAHILYFLFTNLNE